MTSNAHAIALTFKLDIFSSGSDIYACNAGLKHKGYQSRVCYERDQPSKSCNPNLCEEGQACNCVCTGSITGDGAGEYRLDYLRTSFSDWADHGEMGPNSSSVVREAGKNGLNQVLENKVDLKYIQVLLGHNSSKTTEIYTQVATNHLQKIKSPIDLLNLR